MEGKKYAVVILLLVIAAIVSRRYIPTNRGLTFLWSGVERAVSFNILVFWLLIAVAIGFLAGFVWRISHGG